MSVRKRPHELLKYWKANVGPLALQTAIRLTKEPSGVYLSLSISVLADFGPVVSLLPIYSLSKLLDGDLDVTPEQGGPMNQPCKILTLSSLDLPTDLILLF